LSSKNNKHDSALKFLAQLTGQLVKDIEAILFEVETDSYDTGYNKGYADCERENGLIRKDNKGNL